MLRSYALSHPGKKRALNEDALVVDDELGIYIVCDGVGGHAKGEVASHTASSHVLSFLRRERVAIDLFRESPSRETGLGVRGTLERAVDEASGVVFDLAESDPAQRGMATTLSALVVQRRTGFLAQVGDSRIYLVRGGKSHQLTEDHTLINAQLKRGLITPAEAATMKDKNVITRAVGHRDHVAVDLAELALKDGDRFVLCSDGLHGYLAEGELASIVDAGCESAPQRFVDLANDRGGKDNISVVVVVV